MFNPTDPTDPTDYTNPANLSTSGIKGFFGRIIRIFPSRLGDFISRKLGLDIPLRNRTVTVTTPPNNTTTLTAVPAENVKEIERYSTQEKALPTIVEQIFEDGSIDISELVHSSNISPVETKTLKELQALTQQLNSEEDIFKKCFLCGQILMLCLPETILTDTICPKIKPPKIQPIFLKILNNKFKITQKCLSIPFFHRKSNLQKAYLKFKKKQFDFNFDKYCQQLKKRDEEKMEFFLILGLMKTIYQDPQKH